MGIMRINFNASAVIATNSLNTNDNRLQESLARLSSGLKVVNAKDNPSGLAMSKRMNAQIEGINMATQNAGDGVSIIEIADGTLSEVHSMLQRMNELCVKASTEIITDDDRKLIDTEFQQLKEEITRISSETEFNGQAILDGSFDLKGYTNNVNAKVAYYGDAVYSGTYEIENLELSYKADGTIDEVTAFTPKAGTGFPLDAAVSQIDGNIITIKGSKDFEIKIDVSTDTKFEQLKLDLTGFGSMDMQIGANEGQQLGIRIPKISLENMGIASVQMNLKNPISTDGLTTEEEIAGAIADNAKNYAEQAKEASEKIKGAIQYVSKARSSLGAYQNRLEHTISSLDISSENMTAAYSRIMDVDMAEEMTEYTTVQVLSQASTSMLAQANERPSQVLQLLQ